MKLKNVYGVIFSHFFSSILYVEKPCALFCSPVGKEQPVLLSEKVMDGTSCGYQGLDICANGRCQVRHFKKGYMCIGGRCRTVGKLHRRVR
jgi:hypothetical protein